jgi:hypothetical protein
VSARNVAHALEELIAALDRRVPHIERAGEAAIAREAAALRAQAVDRLTQIAGSATVSTTGDPGDPS